MWHPNLFGIDVEDIAALETGDRRSDRGPQLIDSGLAAATPPIKAGRAERTDVRLDFQVVLHRSNALCIFYATL
jgi:hypothetical protein